MNWIHPAFLFGLGAAAVPIVLHLLGRRPSKTIRLPTIELLRRSIETRSRRSRLRELLLMLLRAGAIGAVALGLARPLLLNRTHSIPSAAPKDLYLLIDNTLSMSVKLASGHTAIEEGLRIAKEKIAGLGPSDQCAIASVIPGPGGEVGLTDDRNRLDLFLSEIHVRFEAGQILPRLSQWIPPAQPPGRLREVWVITDGTAASWEQSATFLGDIGVVDVSRGESFVNAGIVSSKISTNWNSTVPGEEIQLDLRSQGPKRPIEVTADAWDSRWIPAARESAQVSESSVQTVVLTLPISASPKLIRVHLPSDALEADNHAVLLSSAQSRPLIAVVNGRPRPIPMEDGAFHLISALRSAGGGSRFTVEEWSPDDLRTKDLSAVRGLFLLDTGLLTPDESIQVAKYVSSGGRVLLSGGETFFGVAEPQVISQLAPGLYKGVSAPSGTAALLSVPPAESVFGTLSPTWERTLGSQPLRRVLAMDLPATAQVLLSRTDGSPALVSVPKRSGRLMVFSGSLSRAWGDLPLTSSFPAFAALLASELVAQKEIDETPPPLVTAPPSGVLRSRLWSAEGLLATRLVDFETGKPSGLTSLEGWELPDSLGLYKAMYRTKKGNGEFVLSTTGDRSEFDLRKVDTKALASRLAPNKLVWNEKVTSLSSKAEGGPKGSTEKSRIFLLLAVLFMILESFLAGRLPRKWMTTAGLTLVLFSPSAFALGPKSHVRVAILELEGGGPPPYADFTSLWLRKAGTMTNIDPDVVPVHVQMRSPDLGDYPFLYASGDRAFPIPSAQDSAKLREYLTRGGFLLLDNASGEPGGAFDRSARAFIRELFPELPLKPLPSEHSLFRSFFLLSSPKLGRKGEEQSVYGVDVGRRTVLAYITSDLGGALAIDAAGAFVADVSGGTIVRQSSLRFAVNALMYALTLDYKQDQIHIPFLLRRKH